MSRIRRNEVAKGKQGQRRGAPAKRGSRRMLAEQLEPRMLLATDLASGALWQNPWVPTDVNGDLQTTPLDALLLISDLNVHGARAAGAAGTVAAKATASVAAGESTPNYLDVNGDAAITALDVLGVINKLNAEGEGVAEQLRVTTKVTGLDGSELTAKDANGYPLIPVGTDFLYQIYVQDRRSQFEATGVFDAYVNIPIDLAAIKPAYQEVQQLTIGISPLPTGGFFNVQWPNSADKVKLDINALKNQAGYESGAPNRAAAVQAALEALPEIGAGNISVAESAVFSFQIVFTGKFLSQAVDQLQAVDTENITFGTTAPAKPVTMSTPSPAASRGAYLSAMQSSSFLAAGSAANWVYTLAPGISVAQNVNLAPPDGPVDALLSVGGANQLRTVGSGTNMRFLAATPPGKTTQDSLLLAAVRMTAMAPAIESLMPGAPNKVSPYSVTSELAMFPATAVAGSSDSLNLWPNQLAAVTFVGTPVHIVAYATAVADQANVDEGSSVNIAVLSNDLALEPGAKQLERIVTNPAGGTVSIDTHGTTDKTDDTISYTPKAYPNFTTTDTFTYEMSDGLGHTAQATVTVTVKQINQAPVNSVPGAQVAFESAPLVFSIANGNGLSITDREASQEGSDVRVTLTVSHGTLTLASLNGLTNVDGDGTATIMLEGRLLGAGSGINYALSGLKYVANSGFIGTDTLSITTNDLGHTGFGGAQQRADSVSIKVQPSTLPFAWPDQGSTAEDVALLCSNLLANDVNAGNVVGGSGMTITAVSSASQKGGTVTLTSPSSVTYQPPANYFGTDTFTYTITDPNGVANDPNYTRTSVGTVTVTVSSVNDPPSGANHTVTTLEDTPYVFKLSPDDFGFSDSADASSANNLLAVRITTVPEASKGTLKLNGATVTAGQFIARDAIAAGQFQFAPTAELNGNPLTSFTFQVQDDGGTANGGVNLDPIAKTMTISVTAVNDAPLRTAGSLTPLNVAEDSADTTAASLGLETVTYGPGGGADEASQTLTVTITSIPSFVQLFKTDGTTQVSASGTLTVGELQGLKYKTVAEANGSGHIVWTVTDSGSAVAPNANALTESLAISVAAFNDVPVRTAGNPAAINVLEDAANSTAVTLGLGGLAYGPGGGSDETQQTLTYKVTAIPAFITAWNGATQITANTVLSLTALQGLTYKTVADANGTGELTWTVTDSGSPAQTLTQSLAITVNAVNDAPVRTAGTMTPISVLEDSAAAPWGLGGVTYSPGGGADETTQTLTITLTGIPTSVQIFKADGTTQVNVGGTLTPAEFQGLRYKPVADASGTGNLTWTVTDSGSGIAPNANTLAESLALTITAVNDAPVGAAHTVSTREDTTYTFQVADFPFSDPHDTPANTLLNVSITTLPDSTAGTLKLSGVAVSAGASISKEAIAAGSLQFVPLANKVGAATFTFQVQDNGGTANNGANLDPTARTLTINVTPVNDPPVNLIGGLDAFATKKQLTNRNMDLAFSAANLNQLSVTDSDNVATATTYTVDLSVTNGQLKIGAGTPAATLHLTGTLADVNLALAGLIFSPTPEISNVDAVLTITSNDGGTTGEVLGPTTDSDTLTIRIAPLNQPPIAHDDQLVVLEQAAKQALEIFVMNDNGNGADSAGANETTQTIKVLSPLGLTGTKGTVELVDAATGKIRYTPPTAYFVGEDKFTYTIQDDGKSYDPNYTGSADHLKPDPATATATVTVTYKPVNQTPIAQDYFKRIDAFPTDNQIVTIPVSELTNLAKAGPDGANEGSQVVSVVGVQSNLVKGVAYATNKGGTVTLSSDGTQIIYKLPTVAAFDHYDYFTYTIQDDGKSYDSSYTGSADHLKPDPKTATAKVEIRDVIPKDLSGAVYVDKNANGIRDTGEVGIQGVTVRLQGTDLAGLSVARSVLTDANGNYVFHSVLPNKTGSPYKLVEQQPTDYKEGIAQAGDLSGSVVDSSQPNEITLGEMPLLQYPTGTQGAGNNFSERGLDVANSAITQTLIGVGLNNLFDPPSTQPASNNTGPSDYLVFGYTASGVATWTQCYGSWAGYSVVSISGQTLLIQDANGNRFSVSIKDQTALAVAADSTKPRIAYLHAGYLDTTKLTVAPVPAGEGEASGAAQSYSQYTQAVDSVYSSW